MSFKERIIGYCEDKQKIDCRMCTFREPCNKTSEVKMPRSFTDAEMTVFESYVKEHRRKLSSQLNDTYKVLNGSSGFVGFLSAVQVSGGQGQGDMEIVRGGQHE